MATADTGILVAKRLLTNFNLSLSGLKAKSSLKQKAKTLYAIFDGPGSLSFGSAPLILKETFVKNYETRELEAAPGDRV